MIIKDKNKVRPKKESILVLGLIFLILIGLFSPTLQANAAGEKCWHLSGTTWTAESTDIVGSKVICDSRGGTWSITAPESPTPVVPPPTPGQCVDSNGIPNGKNFADCKAPDKWQPTTAPTAPDTRSAYQAAVKDACGITTIFPGCLVTLIYYIFYVIPAFLLWASAYFFNILISITLSSKLFAESAFIATGWAVVRDISNIFFILTLLWVAFETILGMAHDAMKTIPMVIIMATIINFSMFATNIVIDTSNIVALIFYNKLEVCTNPDPVTGKCIREYTSATGEKDVAGAMAAAFDPTTKLDANFFKSAGNIPVPGAAPQPGPVPAGILIGITIVAGLIMGAAAYFIFISGYNFLGRMVELFALTVFSPFAFMSFPVPALRKIEYMGWDEWLDNLMKVAFMAPIFMFFLYLIFILIGSHIFDTLLGRPQGTPGFIKTLLLCAIPATIILRLLHKASEAAKKGGGEVGKLLVGAGKAVAGLVGGVALGAATGGVGLLARGTLGRTAANLSESNRLKDFAARNAVGAGILRMTSGIAGSSFDARKAPGVTGLAKKAGLNLDAAKSIGLGPKEGFTQNRAAAVKRREDFANKQLDTSDYGKAELTRGEMSVQRAADIEGQLITGGMTPAAAAAHRASLIANGISAADLGVVTRHLNIAKRNAFADRLDRRAIFTTPQGLLQSNARRGNAAKRMMANTIRQTVASATNKANIAQVAAAFAAAGGVPPPAAGGGAGAAAAGGAAGGGAGAGGGGGAPCWVAEVLYGVNDQRTHAARLWATTSDNLFTRLYKKYGESWAQWLAVHRWAHPVVQPIWDIMAIKGQLLAVKVRARGSLMDKKYNYLLEKIK